ncbi:DUF4136 domain-containing protein [Maribacter sp. 2307ULW6-5]|uniref:DUF4136 domain-containing protein n=1 Tax=Maribacter sp. 2307ULW6-5 TaxID=3386275 RepID=UPI0039BC4A7B
MQKSSFIIFMGALGCLLLGCGPKPIITTETLAPSWERHRTYAYLPNTNFEISSPNAGQNGMVSKNLLRAMNKKLRSLGYKVDRDAPDLLMVINAHYANDGAVYKEPVYAHPEKPDGADAITAQYDPYYYWDHARFNDLMGFEIKHLDNKRAGIVIEAIDRSTKKTLWRGKAKAPKAGRASAVPLTEYIAATLDDFPAASPP